MQQKFYDTDILTDNPPSDMMSEKDLPKDKINKRKLIYKEALIRVHKEIRKSGQNYQKPASFDEIKYRHTTLTDEQYHDPELNELTILDSLDVIQCNIGIPGTQEQWIDRVLQSMKKGEISIIILEHLRIDENDLKVLNKNEFILTQVLSWITVVDLQQDKAYMKRVEQPGQGNERVELQDEIEFVISITYRNVIVHHFASDGPITPSLEDGSIGKNVWKIMKTMKPGERSICTVRNEEFRDREDQTNLNKYLSSFETDIIDHWYIEVEIKTMFKIDDIYGDGVLTKKTIKKGNTTAKADKVSEVQFDLWIYKYNETDIKIQFPNPEQLVYQSCPCLPLWSKLEQKQQKQESKDNADEHKPLVRYIDDRTISKLLRQCLLRVKRKEISIFTCKSADSMMKRGFDSDIVQNSLGYIPKELVYVLKIYNFTEGKNNFTMNLDEKIQQTIRKKKDGLDYIRQSNYSKALKVFKTINAYFDYGTFNEEEKAKMREHQISALMNTSLCQLKMDNWKDLIISTTKTLTLTPNNPKAVYRKAIGLKHVGEYDEALQIINAALEEQIIDDFQNELIILRKEIQKKQLKYKTEQKQIFKKMFEQP